MKILRIALLAFAAWFGAAAAAGAQTGPSMRPVELWPAAPPGGHRPNGPERVERTGKAAGAVSNISRPRMEIYRPAHPDGSAVLIMGGGGYFRIEIGGEAIPAAQWLAALGTTPVVLYYRLPADGWPAEAPFQDAQRALRLLRAHAADYGIDPRRIGVLGFSAGGNLAAIAATRFGHDFYAPVDDADRQSARPDFAGLIYPVISLQPPYDTTRSSRELGKQGDAAQAYSAELHVDHDTPPTFLAQAEDDPIANVGNSLAMFDALRRHGVPAELHVFEKGGHGWGLGQPGTRVAAWPRLFAGWAVGHGFFSAPDSVPAVPSLRAPAKPKAQAGNVDPSDDD